MKCATERCVVFAIRASENVESATSRNESNVLSHHPAHVMQYLYYNQINQTTTTKWLTWIRIRATFSVHVYFESWNGRVECICIEVCWMCLNFKPTRHSETPTKSCVRWWMFKIHHNKLCAKIENKMLIFLLLLFLFTGP